MEFRWLTTGRSFVLMPTSTFCLMVIASGMMMNGSLICACQQETRSDVPDYQIHLQVTEPGYDAKTCWVHARTGRVETEKGARWVMTSQRLDVSGSDLFGPLHSRESSDAGQSWTEWQQQKGFERIRIAGDIEETICDFVPQWHASSRCLLGTGQTVRYQNNHVMKVRPRATAYAVYDADLKRWSAPKQLELPLGPRFGNCGAGSGQRLDLADGTILLPVSFRRPEEQQFHTTVMKLAFDGQHLTYLGHGTEMTVDVKRGLYEPSITEFKGLYYLTMRNDDHGYMAVSENGLDYSEPRQWRFDDGADLGNYNTQQHWLKGAGRLFLVYTRKGLNNDHVFRHRAPLVMAEVDTERLQIVRETERVIIKESGARLGNFGVMQLGDDDACVVVSEWMQGIGSQRVLPVETEGGAANRIFVARITFTEP